jgi:hypothetical protein
MRLEIEKPSSSRHKCHGMLARLKFIINSNCGKGRIWGFRVEDGRGEIV